MFCHGSNVVYLCWLVEGTRRGGPKPLDFDLKNLLLQYFDSLSSGISWRLTKTFESQLRKKHYVSELYSRSDLILSSQIRSGLCVSFKKSSDQSSCLNLNLSFDLKLTSDHWCAFSTVSLCELKITAQVQVQAWTWIWPFFSDHRNEQWTAWSELYELYTTLI